MKFLLTKQYGEEVDIAGHINFANNGVEAVRLVRDNLKEGILYGLIFMDCSMPFLNGYQATQQIRDLYDQHGHQQPLIIACTGHVENEYIQKAWRYGMDEVLPKPATEAIIRDILQEVIIML